MHGIKKLKLIFPIVKKCFSELNLTLKYLRLIFQKLTNKHSQSALLSDHTALVTKPRLMSFYAIKVQIFEHKLHT